MSGVPDDTKVLLTSSEGHILDEERVKEKLILSNAADSKLILHLLEVLDKASITEFTHSDDETPSPTFIRLPLITQAELNDFQAMLVRSRYRHEIANLVLTGPPSEAQTTNPK